MSDSDYIQQTLLNNSESNLSQINNLKQDQNDNRMISIQSSQEFQNIDTSQNHDISASFNTLGQSQSHEQKQQQIIHDAFKNQEQKVQTQQISSELKQEIKPGETQQFQQVHPPQVDYNSMVSIKIFEKKINDSLEFKSQGNEFFKANLYKEAIQKYSEGLRLLDPQQFYGATQAQCQKMAQVSASLLFNIGSCFFNINSWKQAEIYFSETIIINPNHIKAIYKRALCQYELQNYEQAMNDIKLAFSKDKTNTDIYRSYEKILQKYNEQIKKDKQNLKELSSRIFRKDSQNSVALSQKQEQNKEQQENKQKQKCNGQQPSGLWGFAPLLLVVGAGLFLGYKKWFGK